jgi:hypothetical protein
MSDIKPFKPANKDYLQKYWQKWLEFKGSQTVSQLDLSVQKEFARIYNEELDTKAILSTGCGSCIMPWYKVLYINFEKSLQAESVPVIAEAAAQMITIETPAAPVKEPKKKK